MPPLSTNGPMNHAILGYYEEPMKSIALLLLFLLPTQLYSQQTSVNRIPLLREGTKIIDGEGYVREGSDSQPVIIELPRSDKRVVDSFILLPNQRLAEIEFANIEFPNRTFRVSGDVFAFGDHNYLLIREAVTLGTHAQRLHPTSVPIDPNEEIVREEDFEDSVADIVKDLEDATGSLVRSIRNASDNPVEKSSIKEGTRIASRRCHLVRNDAGAWIAVFVSDATGLSDPPCTILPSVSFAELIRWASTQHPSTPVLVSGELLSYHGHGFLLVSTWRPVHTTDHLD